MEIVRPQYIERCGLGAKKGLTLLLRLLPYLARLNARVVVTVDRLYVAGILIWMSGTIMRGTIMRGTIMRGTIIESCCTTIGISCAMRVSVSRIRRSIALTWLRVGEKHTDELLEFEIKMIKRVDWKCASLRIYCFILFLCCFILFLCCFILISF